MLNKSHQQPPAIFMIVVEQSTLFDIYFEVPFVRKDIVVFQSLIAICKIR